MAKYRKRKKKKCRIPRGSHHHLCWTRRDWTGAYTSRLRNFHYCIVKFPPNSMHGWIHEAMDGIPVPRESSAKEVLEQLVVLDTYGGISDKDDIEKRLKVLIALFDCIEEPTAEAFRQQLEVVKLYSKKSH